MSAFALQIDIQGARELSELWRIAPEITREELTRTTWEAEKLLEREIKEATPIGATSALRESIAAREPQVLADNVLGVVGTSLAHALPVELGTKPHFPPVAPLVDWVRSKLDVKDEAEAESIAFAIARKIARKGTVGAQMFAAGFDRTEAQIERMYAEARSRIVARLAGSA